MPPIAIDFQPSRQLMMLLAVMHVIAIVAVLALQIDWALKFGISVAVLVSVWHSLRTVSGVGQLRLYLGRQNQCEIEKVGVRETALLQAYSMVFDKLLVLSFTGNHGKRTLVVMPDSTDTDSLRRLRVWLKTSSV